MGGYPRRFYNTYIISYGNLCVSFYYVSICTTKINAGPSVHVISSQSSSTKGFKAFPHHAACFVFTQKAKNVTGARNASQSSERTLVDVIVSCDCSYHNDTFRFIRRENKYVSLATTHNIILLLSYNQ
jgi:hypothetical protein